VSKPKRNPEQNLVYNPYVAIKFISPLALTFHNVSHMRKISKKKQLERLREAAKEIALQSVEL
jgi:hypothetical protein